MAIFWVIVFGFLWAAFTIADQVVRMKASTEEKNSLVPNGYAIEYKVSVEAFRELEEVRKEIMGDLPFYKDPALYKERDEKARLYMKNRVSSEFPEAFRLIEKHNITETEPLMCYYSVMKGRLAAYNAKRNPMHYGGIDPKPLPTDPVWYVYEHTDSALNYYNGTRVGFDEVTYNRLKEQDAVSERELARVRAEWNSTHPIS